LGFYLYSCYQILFLYLYGIFLFYLMDILLSKLLLLLIQHFYFSQLHILLFPCCVNLLLHRCSSSYFLLLHRLSHLHMLLKILYYQSVCLLYLLFFCYCIYFFLPCIVLLYSLILRRAFSLFYIFSFLILLCLDFLVLL